MSRRWGALLLMVVLCASAGCEKVHHSVSSSVSPCFRLLPQAHAALGDRGSLESVVRIRGEGVDRFLGPHRAVLGDERRDVCVIAYRGGFRAESIPSVVGDRQDGSYGLVVVGVLSQRVRAVLLSDVLPPPLHHH